MSTWAPVKIKRPSFEELNQIRPFLLICLYKTNSSKLYALHLYINDTPFTL